MCECVYVSMCMCVCVCVCECMFLCVGTTFILKYLKENVYFNAGYNFIQLGQIISNFSYSINFYCGHHRTKTRSYIYLLNIPDIIYSKMIDYMEIINTFIT